MCPVFLISPPPPTIFHELSSPSGSARSVSASKSWTAAELLQQRSSITNFSIVGFGPAVSLSPLESIFSRVSLGLGEGRSIPLGGVLHDRNVDTSRLIVVNIPHIFWGQD